tara:strand:- start:131 stop:316 length:186 start_codon:yes stop_codon:yes gene_type:complete
MIQKFKEWLVATGLKNIGWLGGVAAAFLFIGGGVGTFLAGACAIKFIELNLKVLWGLANKI